MCSVVVVLLLVMCRWFWSEVIILSVLCMCMVSSVLGDCVVVDIDVIIFSVVLVLISWLFYSWFMLSIECIDVWYVGRVGIVVDFSIVRVFSVVGVVFI